MISKEKALNYLKDKQDSIDSITLCRLYDKEILPIGDARLNESPEDVLIQTLNNKETPEVIRHRIIKKCTDVYNHFIYQIRNKKGIPGELKIAMTRLCRIGDLSYPKKLKDEFNNLLFLVIPPGNIPNNLAGAIIRANMSYKNDQKDISVWEKLMEYQEYAAYAFNALLNINPEFQIIEQNLHNLREHQEKDGWKVDVDFLAKRYQHELKKV